MIFKEKKDFQHILTYNPETNSFFDLNHKDRRFNFNNSNYEGFKQPQPKTASNTAQKQIIE
jgi:hypothetical protein